MRANRGALAREDEARDGLCRPACKTGDELSPHITIPVLRFSSRRSMRRVSSSSHGRAMGGERSVRIGACPGRREVSRLERIRVGTDVPGARKRGGGRLIEPDGVLEELKGSRIRIVYAMRLSSFASCSARRA